jgi:hypothetical protein
LSKSQIYELRIEYSDGFDGYALLLSRQILVPECIESLRIDHFHSNAHPHEVARCFVLSRLQKLQIKYKPDTGSSASFIKEFYSKLMKLKPALDFKLVNLDELVDLEL